MPPTPQGEGMAYATFLDPAGNVLGIFQEADDPLVSRRLDGWAKAMPRLWQYFSHVLKAPPGVRLARRRDLTRSPALREECRGPRGQPRAC